jgi:hypothetical protein
VGRRKSRRHEKAKPLVRPGETTIRVNKKRAAVGQLETAITLWFQCGDPVSMHAPAIAAHDCLATMSEKAGHTSFYWQWLKVQRPAHAARFAYFQNFIKHGAFEPDAEVEHSLWETEALIGFACDCYRFVFSSLTPLMELFALRSAMEDPVRRDSSYPLWVKETFNDDADNISRADFLAKYLPILNVLAADDSVDNLQFP